MRPNINLLFLLALAKHADRLQQLLGVQWIDFHRNLQSILTALLDRTDPTLGPLLINQIINTGLNSPAAPLIRELLTQARDLAGQTNETTRSVTLTDPTTGQQRRVALEAKADDEAAELTAAARTLSRALETQDAASSERRINAWIGDQPDQPHPPLQPGRTYTLSFRVGRPVRASLIDDLAAVVPDSDVPPGGLNTRWVIIAQGVELAAVSPEVRVQASSPNGSSAWSARFDLLIPEQGESERRQLRITPRRTGARLEVDVYAGLEPYRRFTVRLDVRQDSPDIQGPVILENDHSDTPAGQTNLATPHGWATPPGTLTLRILGNVASVMGEWDNRSVDQDVDLPDLEKEAAAPIERVLEAAERFREDWGDYLDGIDPQDLIARLQSWWGDEFWNQLPDHADQAHHQAWEAAARSNELHDLAYQGHWLYETFFPRDSKLRGWLDELPLGARLNVSWQRGPGRIPHVPWGMMYLPEPPAAGQLVDPQGFLALRLRLAYFPYASDAHKDLGGLDQCYRAHCLYWGNDTTGVEAHWQRDQWQGLPNQVFMPSGAAGADLKRDVLRLLERPEPPPVTLLYLFCQAGSPTGSGPRLRFGATPGPEHVLEQRELGIATLMHKPLVFANACATLGGDPYRVNDLQQLFFRRGCRAYLGTEIKVPIQLASRFAALFFHFFYRQAAAEPLAAGEAVVQARLFLWTRYRNIGGIFYSYVNQYELFMADAAEVRAMSRPRRNTSR